MLETIEAEWIDYLKQNGKSHHTVSAYKRATRHFTEWYRRQSNYQFSIGDIETHDLVAWKTYQVHVEGNAPTTINQRLVAVSRFFQWATDKCLCEQNPATNMRMLPVSDNLPESLSEDEVGHLLAVIQSNLRDQAIIHLMISTGLLVSELLTLRIRDLRLNHSSSELVLHHGEQSRRRTIPLPANVRQVMYQYLSEKHPNPADDNEFLWYGRQGPLAHRSSIMRLLKKYVRQAGIKETHPQMLRHTFAIRYLTTHPNDLVGLANILGLQDLSRVVIYSALVCGEDAQLIEGMVKHVSSMD